MSFDGITHDICPGGVFIVTSQVLPPKSTVDLELWLDGYSVPILSQGEVVWANEGQFVYYPPGFGVRFLDLSGESVEFLMRFCSDLDEYGF